jgi:hypothetical protein
MVDYRANLTIEFFSKSFYTMTIDLESKRGIFKICFFKIKQIEVIFSKENPLLMLLDPFTLI